MALSNSRTTKDLDSFASRKHININRLHNQFSLSTEDQAFPHSMHDKSACSSRALRKNVQVYPINCQGQETVVS